MTCLIVRAIIRARSSLEVIFINKLLSTSMNMYISDLWLFKKRLHPTLIFILSKKIAVL